MEIVSGINIKKKRCSFNVEVYPYLLDHYLEGKAIFPAVEALIVLARAIQTVYSQSALNSLKSASFPRFLNIMPETKLQPVVIDIEDTADDGIVASLLTSIKSKTGNISRGVEHARATFSTADSTEGCASPFHKVEKMEGECISIPSITIYHELVPFGKAYQNIIGDLSVSTKGALAYVYGGNGEADDELLGSPFPLDAVMHAACVWGQRFSDRVCFPVGFEKRVIHQKTKKGKEYLGRVFPVSVTQDALVFDAWIYDKDDKLCESINGIQMKDVTKGRMRPPEWIKTASSPK